jgi:hypothetical protein
MIKSCWCQDAGLYTNHRWGRHGRDHMVVGFPNYRCNQCLSPLMVWDWTPFRQGVLDTTLCDKVCKWLATCWWVSPVSSTNKIDRHDITNILLKVVLNTINQTYTNLLTIRDKDITNMFIFVTIRTNWFLLNKEVFLKKYHHISTFQGISIITVETA